MKRTLILICIVSCFSGAAYLSAAETLDLDGCMDLAVQNNLQLQQEEISLRTAANESGNVWSYFLPSMSISAGLTRSDTLFTENMMAGDDPVSYSGGVSLGLQLNHGVAASIDRTNIAYQQAEVQYETVKDRITDTVTSQFYNLIMLQEESKILEEDLDLAEQQLEKSRIRFQNGLINEQTLLRARLDVESAKLSRSRLLAEYEQARRSFFSTLGIESSAAIELSGEIAPEIVEIEVESLIGEYLGNRTDIRSAYLQVKQLQAVSRSTKASSRAPSLSLSGRWNVSPEEVWNANSDSYSLGLSVSIPVDSWIPGSRDDQSITSAVSNVEKSRLNLEQVRKQAELEVRSLAAALDQSRQSIQIARLQEEIAQRSYDLAEEGFQKGTVERLELGEIRKELLSARQNLLSERYQYLLSLNELLNALNLDNPEKLVHVQGE